MEDIDSSVDSRVLILEDEESDSPRLFEVLPVRPSGRRSSSMTSTPKKRSVSQRQPQPQQQQGPRVSSSSSSRGNSGRTSTMNNNSSDVLLSYETNDTLNQDYLKDGEQLTDSAKEKFKKMQDKLGPYCKSIVVSPNWSNNKASEVPSGYSLTVKNSAPINADLFPVKFFHGTIALRLDESTKFKDGTPVTESYILGNKDKISIQMNSFISETTPHPLKLSYMPQKSDVRINGSNGSGRSSDILRDILPEGETKGWEPCLGTYSGSYAGIFTSVVRDVDRYKKTFWLVIQSGIRDASNDLFSLIENCQPNFDINRSVGADPKKNQTWGSFFRSDKVMYTFLASERSRRLLLARLSESLNLDLNFSQDMSHNLSGGGKADYLQPSIETITNSISYGIDKERLVTFSNATINPVNTNGIILNENPLLGPVILKGPSVEGREFGGGCHHSVHR